MFQESRFRSALKVLSTAPAAAANIDDVKMDEFVIAEQIKKFLVNRITFVLFEHCTVELELIYLERY